MVASRLERKTKAQGFLGPTIRTAVGFGEDASVDPDGLADLVTANTGP
jgi:hypothetical protein